MIYPTTREPNPVPLVPQTQNVSTLPEGREGLEEGDRGGGMCQTITKAALTADIRTQVPTDLEASDSQS